MLDIDALFFFSIVWDTFNIDTGIGRGVGGVVNRDGD